MRDDPKLYADARGIWREDKPGGPFGIEWHEIYFISGYKIDTKIDILTNVTLDFENGHFLELIHDWPGFDQVIESITKQLQGIDADWFQRIDRLGIDDAPIVVWKRQD